MNIQQTYNTALDNGSTHAQAVNAVEQSLAPNYRACWHNEAGQLVKGEFIDFDTAVDEVLFLQSCGRVAWAEDRENNRIEFEEK